MCMCECVCAVLVNVKCTWYPCAGPVPRFVVSTCTSTCEMMFSHVGLISTHPLLPPPNTNRTYGNLTCGKYVSGGFCQDILGIFPEVLTNLSRSDQIGGSNSIDMIISVLAGASPYCQVAAIPLLCRYTFPTCDPAFDIPVYQPICRRDCEIVRDFICPEPWQIMLQLLSLLDFGVIDQPDCGPLRYASAGNAPMCISTLDGGGQSCVLHATAVCTIFASLQSKTHCTNGWVSD